MSKEKDEVGAKRKKVRGHIPGGVFKQIVDTDDPIEEAAGVAAFTSGIANGVAGWSGRMQKRLRYGIRYFEALKDSLDYAHEAFAQVAEEAITDSMTEEEVTETKPFPGPAPGVDE